MDDIRQAKVQRFEEFVDRRLKPDLVRAVAERDKVFEQQKIFSDLKKNIENLEKNGVTNLRTLVNIGSEVYAQADVPDTRRIFVDVGLGFHVEFTWSEAVEFISVKEARLAKQIEEYTCLIASIKAQIKMVRKTVLSLIFIPFGIISNVLGDGSLDKISHSKYVKVFGRCSNFQKSDMIIDLYSVQILTTQAETNLCPAL